VNAAHARITAAMVRDLSPAERESILSALSAADRKKVEALLTPTPEAPHE
jgi:hypothetical protein